MPADPPRRVNRFAQATLLAALAALSWLGMMATHEFGHALAAWCTGGHVQRVVLHPLAFSRTDVEPNPSPGAVAWAGPILGVLLPTLAYALSTLALPRAAPFFGFFAGFCLLANGAYIGLGSFEGIADAGVMLAHGSPRGVLLLFGAVAVPAGLWIWHRVSGRFGFGRDRQPVEARVAAIAAIVALAAIATLAVVSSPPA